MDFRIDGKMDNKLIIHVVGETLVIGGLTFYVKRTADQLSARISDLEKQVKAQKEALDGMHAFLRNLFPPHPPPLVQSPHVPQVNQGPTPEQEEEKRLQEILRSAKQKKSNEKLVLKGSKAKGKSKKEADVSTEKVPD